MTNLEGRVLLRRQAVAPPDGVRSDIDILSALATRLGKGEHIPPDPISAFAELRRASSGGTADYAGISTARIEREHGIFWPCPDEGHPGSPRLFLQRFAHEDGLARFSPVQRRMSAEEPDATYPLYLTTGRVLTHYQTGAQTRRVPELLDAEPDAFVEIHPDTAASAGIVQGAMALLTTRRGNATFRARLTPGIRRDTLFVPFHWGGASSANLLTNNAIDPVSKIPEFKVCAVRLGPAPAPSP